MKWNNLTTHSGKKKISQIGIKWCLCGYGSPLDENPNPGKSQTVTIGCLSKTLNPWAICLGCVLPYLCGTLCKNICRMNTRGRCTFPSSISAVLCPSLFPRKNIYILNVCASSLYVEEAFMHAESTKRITYCTATCLRQYSTEEGHHTNSKNILNLQQERNGTIRKDRKKKEET